MAKKKPDQSEPQTDPQTDPQPVTASEPARVASDVPLRVRARQRGFYRGNRRRANSEFTLEAGDVPGRWMEVLGEEASQLPDVPSDPSSDSHDPPASVL